VLAESRAAKLDDPLKEAARIVTEHGKSAWAFLYSNGKVDGPLPAEGKIAASVVAAHHGLLRYLRREIGAVVGEKRERESAAEVSALAAAILALDIDIKLAVKLLGGIPPREASGRQQSAVGSGRWGSVSGPTAPQDMERGLSRLAELVASVHGAGGGTLGDLHFGLVELAQMAWETLEEGDVSDLFTDVASKAARAARERRLGASSTPIDISAIVRKARHTTLPNMEMSTITRREAAEATRAALGKRGRTEGEDEAEEGGGKRGKKAAAERKRQQEQKRAEEAARNADSASRFLSGGPPPPPPPPPPTKDVRFAPPPPPPLRPPTPPRGGAAAGDASARRKMAAVIESIPDGSVGRLTAPKGTHSMAGLFDAMQIAVRGTGNDDHACPFAHMRPPCRRQEDGSCTKCPSKSDPPPGLVEMLMPKLTLAMQAAARTQREAAGLKH